MVDKGIQLSISRIVHRLLPYTCVLCCDQGVNNRDLCEACFEEFPYITKACAHCGLGLVSANSGENVFCGQCLKFSPLYHKAISLFAYEPPISWLIQGLKFNAKLQYGRLLADLMTQSLQLYLSSPDAIRPDMIIPVPLHRNRLKTRGYNQALELAKPMADALMIPLDINSCMRVKDTALQTDLPAKKRRANVHKAFALREKITVKNIALVDDVMTTGATANELAKLLLKNGTENVQVWTVARTHRRG